MFAIRLYQANRAVHRIATNVTQQAYRAGSLELRDHSQEWIEAQVHRISQGLSRHPASSATVTAQIGRLQDTLATTKTVAQAMQAQTELKPAGFSLVRVRFNAWRTARQVRKLDRQIQRLTQRREHILEREDFIVRWIACQTAALRQEYLAVFEPARKAQELRARLDNVKLTGIPLPMQPESALPQTSEMAGTQHPAHQIDRMFEPTTHAYSNGGSNALE